MLVYWLIFAAFSVGAISYASALARPGFVPVSGPIAEAASRRSVVLSAAALALLLLIGLRYDVGGDWENYLDIYRRLAPQDIASGVFGSRQEPGYTLINLVAARVGAGIWLVNLLCALPFIYGLLRLSRQQPNPWLALVVAAPFLIIVVGMGYTRQAAAMGFLMIGLCKIIDGRPPLQFILWTLAGALFHRTVLVFVPVMLVAGVRNKLASSALVLCSLVLAYFVVLPGAMDQYGAGYIRQTYTAAGAGIRVLMNVVPAAVLLLFSRRFCWSAEERAVWGAYAALCIAGGLAMPFINSNVIVDRLAIYLIPVQIFVYARIGYCFGLVRKGWLMWTVAVIVYSAAVLYVWLNYAVNAFAWVPYQNYLMTSA